MSGLKKIKEKHPDIGYLFAAIISFVLYAVALALIFTLPKKASNSTAGGRSRTLSPSDITDSTGLSPSGDLVFDFNESGVTESIKISTDASAVSIGPFNENKYVFKVSKDADYYIDITYTVSGLNASNFKFEIYLSDGDGNNQVKLNDSQYTFVSDPNTANAKYDTNGVTYLHHVVITYQVN